MSPSVIVYSPNEIRGKILISTLKLSGIEADQFANHFETEEASRHYSPSILILDVANNLQNEIIFLKKILNNFTEISVVALAKTTDIASLKGMALDIELCVADPLDPESVLFKVREILILLRRKKFSVKNIFFIAYDTILWMINIFRKALPIAITLAVGLAGGYIYWCVATLPKIGNLEHYSPYESSRLYSSDNTLLSEFYVERRTFVSHKSIPLHVKNALIAVEDLRFYKHHGIDFVRIASALLTNIKRGSIIQGGSTITQQLAKMIFLKPEKTITRKIQEIVISFHIENKYKKEEILGLYFNQAYFGARAYGIEAASQAYFGKSVKHISISEAALLAALPKAPSKYSPFKNPKKAENRRNFALKRMLVTGFINQNEYNKALTDPIPTTFHGRKYKFPYFVDYCKSVLEKRYGDRLYTSGLKIYTTVDDRMQRVAEEAVKNGLNALKERSVENLQAALFSIALKDGHIKAIVGGTNFWDSQFNRVTQAKRQPGSAFKPFVYLTALDQGYDYNDTIDDEKSIYKLSGPDNIWIPHNYDNVYRGSVTLKTALALSLNAATVDLAKKIDIKNVIGTASRLGIKSTIYPFYSSALGASEMTLMEMVCAYAAFSHGFRVAPVCITKIADKEQFTIIEPSGLKERVISERSVEKIKEMLNAVVTNGTGWKAKELKRKVYGKTGTTNDHADALFIGFDDDVVTGVWVGMDNRKPIGEKETGASAALPIWIEYMREVAK
ncbi:MAG: PBP1A family penicillin-binding protein [Deltaproteobacteria bacterium]|nr:PBP1A family penicillin-binding protein [Deltaproteobacteria bacterium]